MRIESKGKYRQLCLNYLKESNKCPYMQKVQSYPIANPQPNPEPNFTLLLRLGLFYIFLYIVHFIFIFVHFDTFCSLSFCLKEYALFYM